MLLMVKEELVSHDEVRGVYVPDGLRGLGDDDFGRVGAGLAMIKAVCLRQLYHVTDSVRARAVVGLRELYGFDGNLYEAAGDHPELRDAWAPVMDLVTSIVDPWFLEHVEVGDGARCSTWPGTPVSAPFSLTGTSRTGILGWSVSTSREKSRGGTEF